MSQPQPPEAHDRSAMLDELRALVQHGQKRWQRLIMAEALGLAIATPLAWLWLVFLADNLLHLNRLGRLAGIVVFVGVVIGLVVRLRRRWRQSQFSEDEVALAIERRTPNGVENRLINALQLARDQRLAGSQMSAAVLEENYRTLKTVVLRQSTESTPAFVRLGAAALLIIIGVGYWFFGGEGFSRSAQRLFLPFADIEPAYRTVLTVTPGDMELALGGDATITIAITGELPREVLILTDDGGRQATRELPVPPNTRTLTYTFEQVRRSTAYAVRGNDFTSRFYRLGVPAQLQLEQVRVQYHYPAYTGLKDREVSSSSGDLEALAGSTATLSWQFNQDLNEPMLWLWTPRAGVTAPPAGPLGEAQYSEETHTLERHPLSALAGGTYGGELAFGQAVAYQIAASGDRGQTVLSPPYMLVAKADRPPELELTGSEPTMTVMSDTVMPLGVQARDDFGLREVGLFYRRVPATGQATEGAPGLGPLDALAAVADHGSTPGIHRQRDAGGQPAGSG